MCMSITDGQQLLYIVYCSAVNLDLLAGDLRELVQGMKLATGELINNKQNKRLKVCE